MFVAVLFCIDVALFHINADCALQSITILLRPASCGVCGVDCSSLLCLKMTVASLENPQASLLGLDPATAYIVTAIAGNCVGDGTPVETSLAALAAPDAPVVSSVVRGATDFTFATAIVVTEGNGGCAFQSVRISACPTACGASCTCVTATSSTPVSSPVQVALEGLDDSISYDVTAVVDNCFSLSATSGALLLPPGPTVATPPEITAFRNPSSLGDVTARLTPGSDGGCHVVGYTVTLLKAGCPSCASPASGDPCECINASTAASSSSSVVVEFTGVPLVEWRASAHATNCKGGSTESSAVTIPGLPAAPIITNAIRDSEAGTTINVGVNSDVNDGQSRVHAVVDLFAWPKL
jgi:hypothetical protein